MTNKIDELWGEALDKAVPDTYSTLTWTQVEKIKQVFAELIVRECATLAYDGPNGILEHFGVEE